MGTASTAAKRAYVAAMRAASGVAMRAGVDAAAPPRERRTAHWLASLPRIYDSAALVELDVPWWTYRAIDAVDAWLAQRATRQDAPVRVFEYGSGASTRWLAKRTDEVHTVEHDAQFWTSMAPVLAADDRIRSRLVEPVASTAPSMPSGRDGFAAMDFADYVASIDDVDGVFDLVVVDGRARTACLARARSRLAPGGIVVFDNSLRRRYRAAVEDPAWRHRRLVGRAPTLPYPEATSLLQPIGR